MCILHDSILFIQLLEFPQEVHWQSECPIQTWYPQTSIPASHMKHPLIFWEECLDKDNDVCVTGNKKKAFCGDIYCSNRPWQQLDSMVITNNQEENWAFLLPELAARSRWSQFHLQYFYPGCSGTVAFWGATEQPGSQKPHGDLFPMDSLWNTLGTQKHVFADVRGSSGS